MGSWIALELGHRLANLSGIMAFSIDNKHIKLIDKHFYKGILG